MKKSKSHISPLPLSAHNIPFPLSVRLLLCMKNQNKVRRCVFLLKKTPVIFVTVFTILHFCLLKVVCRGENELGLINNVFYSNNLRQCEEMEETESTTIERTTGQDGHQAADHMLSKSSKPLHRFVQKGPRILGVTH